MDRVIVEVGAAVGIGVVGMGLVGVAAVMFYFHRRAAAKSVRTANSDGKAAKSKKGGKTKGGAAPKKAAKARAKKGSSAKYSSVATDLMSGDWGEV